MSGRFWDAVAGAAESRVPRAGAGLGWEFVAAQRVGPHPGRSPGPLLVDTATPAACDHGAAAGWQPQSTHRTSTGTVTYARCRCGAWLVLLDGQPLAAAHPRPRAATPPTPGEHPHGRGRLWDHGQGLWKKRTWRQRRRADPRWGPAMLSNPTQEGMIRVR